MGWRRCEGVVTEEELGRGCPCEAREGEETGVRLCRVLGWCPVESGHRPCEQLPVP